MTQPEVTDEMLFDAIIGLAKESAELIHNLALLLQVQGKIPDDAFHRMVKSANTIQKDALKLEQKHKVTNEAMEQNPMAGS